MPANLPPPRFLYFHGGPGLSSFPDQRLLSSVQSEFDLHFWNEPSNLRPEHSDHFDSEQAFRNWMASAENFLMSHWLKGSTPLVVVAHSFACVPLLQIANRHQQKLDGLILISPIFDLSQAYRRTLERARKNLVRTRSKLVRDLDEQMESSREPFDAAMIRALEFAMADSELPLYFWRNQEAWTQWQLALASDARAVVDLKAWRAVLQDLYWEFSYLQVSSLPHPIQIITGIDDPLSDRSGIESFLRINPQTRVESWSRCGHYAHLENQEELGHCLLGMSQQLQLRTHIA